MKNLNFNLKDFALLIALFTLVSLSLSSCSSTHGIKDGTGSNDGASWGMERRCGK
jgi:hypothetical protein